MKALNPQAHAIFNTLTAGLAHIGDNRKIDNAEHARSGIMAVCVERIGPRIYSIAHYFEQNGDLMRDPDVTLLEGPDGHVYPMSFEMSALGLYDVYVQFTAGDARCVDDAKQADLTEFCEMWFQNIKEQQSLSVDPVAVSA